MKQCVDCQTVKKISEFHVRPRNKDGYDVRCKACRAIRYNKADPDRVARIIYERQVGHSANRGHPVPAYTLEQLKQWMDAQPNLLPIWDAYVQSGYANDLKLSIDRIDNDQPYTFSNLQLMTWAENRKKYAQDRKYGRAKVTERAVRAVHLDGTPYKTYHSIMAAVRDIKGNMHGVVSVANGKPIKDGRGYLYRPKTYKGFAWEWI